jgi:hypothetical protein
VGAYLVKVRWVVGFLKAKTLMAAVLTAQGGHPSVYSWSVEYAKSNRSTCQATGDKIEQGAVRIGKEAGWQAIDERRGN